MAEQRFNVMEMLRDGLTVIEVAERYGVSRQTVHGWLRRYRTGGPDALADRPHRPRRCPHQMPVAVEARLCELRRRHPHWGQRRLAHEPLWAGASWRGRAHQEQPSARTAGSHAELGIVESK